MDSQKTSSKEGEEVITDDVEVVEYIAEEVGRSVHLTDMNDKKMP